MDCEGFQENASRFMDGMLQAGDQARLFAHLSTCYDCRAFLESSVSAREVIRKDPASLPAGIDEEIFEHLASHRILQSANQSSRKPLWRREVLLSYPLAAAALLLVVLASLLFSVLFMRTGPGGSVLETVMASRSAGTGRQTVIVVYQLPEEQVLTVPPSKIFEVKARTVAN